LVDQVYRKKAKSSLNFKKWLLTLLSIGNFILAPLIIYMGYQASQFDFNDLLIVDKALISMGIWVFFISVVSIISKVDNNK
jgi:peptidoglycan biosynthesis protein MviN/MurJ (putative lipid II flippase)